MTYQEAFDYYDYKKINILGQVYTIIFTNKINKDCDADSNWRHYTININKTNCEKDFSEGYFKELLRHEIIHCFMRESGLDMQIEENKSWVHNEGLIDWLSLQWPKINLTFEELCII